MSRAVINRCDPKEEGLRPSSAHVSRNVWDRFRNPRSYPASERTRREIGATQDPERLFDIQHVFDARHIDEALLHAIIQNDANHAVNRSDPRCPGSGVALVPSKYLERDRRCAAEACDGQPNGQHCAPDGNRSAYRSVFPPRPRPPHQRLRRLEIGTRADPELRQCSIRTLAHLVPPEAARHQYEHPL